MLLTLDKSARRVLRRLSQGSVYSALEIALIALLAIQCARLVWAVVTPVGPVGDWRGDSGISVAAPDIALFERFDPFFRSENTGPIVVTDLDLRLFGVREDRASGRGSAIIATPDGEQNNFLVGEEIMPGVMLQAVDFDSITIERNGNREQVFLDQSSVPVPGRTASVPAPPSPPPATAAPATVNRQAATSSEPSAVTARQLAGGTQISPRREGNRLTGIIVHPTDDGSTLAAAGFQPGDVILAINGEPIRDMGQAASFATQMSSGNASVQVERGGETVTVRPRISQ